MNISNIIIQLQEKINSATESLELMTYAKIIEKLKVGKVDVVATFNDLPTLDTNGNVFLVESEQELYYNIGTLYTSLGNIATIPVLSWGSNGNGRLGDGTNIQRSSPVTIVGGITNWSQVSAGAQHSLGVTDTGIAYAWGNNNNGQLGDGTFNSKSSPVTLLTSITNWTQLSAGSGSAGMAFHSLGLTDSGDAYGWGHNNHGQVGAQAFSFSFNTNFGDTGSLSAYTSDFFGEPSKVDIGTNAGTFTITDISSVFNELTVEIFGFSFNGLYIDIPNLSAVGPGITAINFMTFYDDTNNIIGDAGSFSTSPTAVTSFTQPAVVSGNITNWSQVSAGRHFSLGVTDTGIAYAWGSNYIGQLGDGTRTNRSSPVTVAGGITNWSQVAAGDQNSLGVTDAGVAYGWGYNGGGRLGDGTTTARSSPVTVVGGITNWSQVDTWFGALGLTDSGIAYTWGPEPLYSDVKSSPVTVTGGITNWSQVAVGNTHSFGLTDAGVAYGWGNNNNGQVGDGTRISRSSPVTVIGGSGWTNISAGYSHSLAVISTSKTFSQ